MPTKSDREALAQLALFVIAAVAILSAGVLGTQVTQEIIQGISNFVLAVILIVVIAVCFLVVWYLFLRNGGSNRYT